MPIRANAETPPGAPVSVRAHTRSWFAAALLAALPIACSDGRSGLQVSGEGVQKQTPTLWTLFEIKAAMVAGKRVAETASYPGFGPAELLKRTEEDDSTLRIQPAFSEGGAAAFVITDVWTDFDEIWLQPWYFLITSWNPASPTSARLQDTTGEMPKNTPPIFDPPPTSRFYTPFWQIFYVEVPANTPPTKYTSSEGLFNDGLMEKAHKGSIFTYTTRPRDVTLPPDISMTNAMTMVTTTRPAHPIIGTAVGNVNTQDAAWVDGKSYAYFTEGGGNFTFDEHLVIEEVPLFEFIRPTGERIRFKHAGEDMDVPRVMGSAPLYSHRPAAVLPPNTPRFGAYSRMHQVVVSSATAVPYELSPPESVTALMTLKIDPKTYEGRIALNGGGTSSCFKDMTFPASCNWLDSQSKVEDGIGRANIRPTNVTMASPLVFFNGRGIGQ